jgi:hypothetical protein
MYIDPLGGHGCLGTGTRQNAAMLRTVIERWNTVLPPISKMRNGHILNVCSRYCAVCDSRKSGCLGYLELCELELER